MNADPDAHTLGHKTRKHAIELDGLSTDGKRAAHETVIADQDARDAYKAQLLAQHSQNKVGVCFRQIMQFLNGSTQPHPEQFSAAESNQRVTQLVGLIERIVAAPGIEIRHHTLQSPRRVVNHERHHRHHGDGHHHEDAQIEPPKKEHAHGDCHGHHDGAQVRLQTDEAGHHTHHERHGPQPLAERVHVVLTAHGKGGGPEQNRKLGKLGDLQIHEPQIDPAS